MNVSGDITSFAPKEGYICDAKKHKKAFTEKYDFRLVSPGYFLCVNGDNAYAISEYAGKVGCGCEDMTYRCPGDEVCKHLIAFLNLDEYPLKPIDDEHRNALKAAGWTGTKLHPPKNVQATKQDVPEQKRKQPNIHDPERKPTQKANKRAETKQNYAGKTAEQMVRAMSDKELARNAKKGGVAAIAEVKRRAAEEE